MNAQRNKDKPLTKNSEAKQSKPSLVSDARQLEAFPVEADTVPNPTSPEAIDATLKRTCEPYPGLYAFIHRGPRQLVIYDKEFPVRSLYACQVLDGIMLNDDRLGSYCMKRNLVIRLAAKYGLQVVDVRGTYYWQDDVREPV